MTNLSFPAWHERTYISLSEILDRIDIPISRFEWTLEVEEWAPNPATDDLPSHRAPIALPGAEFEDIIRQPNVQIVDGNATAWKSGEPVIRLSAMDSTSWDIATEDQEVVARIRQSFEGVDEY
jgi:hypothetical protein